MHGAIHVCPSITSLYLLISVRPQFFRRLFSHPTAIFFERGIACLKSKRMASLSIEKAEGHSFSGIAFALTDCDDPMSLLSREEEFGFEVVDFSYLDGSGVSAKGLVCTSSTDEVYLQRWGEERFAKRYTEPFGINSIWDDWNTKDSGILPCCIYLRHVYLAAKSAGPEMLNSLLDETFLADRLYHLHAT